MATVGVTIGEPNATTPVTMSKSARFTGQRMVVLFGVLALGCLCISHARSAPATASNPPAVPSATADMHLWDPGAANLNPDDDEVVGPPDVIPDCEERLRALGVKFRPATLPVVKHRGLVCGAPQVVQYIEGPEHVKFYPQPIVTCQLALALGNFEHLLNRTALEILGKRVKSIKQGGTYNCRSMARFRLVSEHSYANAIDLFEFGLSDAQTVVVLKHFGRPSEPARSAQSRFLRTLAQRAYDENVFSVVVTRFYDELHRNHLHVDMAHYHTDGSR